MFFYLRLTKNYRMISQLYYKQKTKTFSVNTKSWYKINDVSNKFGSFIINPVFTSIKLSIVI